MNLFYKSFRASFRFVPSSKSLTNRYLFFSFLYPCFRSLIINYLYSKDVLVMLNNLININFNFRVSSSCIYIRRFVLRVLSCSFNFSNAGTVARPLFFFLVVCFCNSFFFDGDSNMRKRPMDGLMKIINDNFHFISPFSFCIVNNVFNHPNSVIGFFPVCVDNRFLIYYNRFIFVDCLKSSQFVSSLIMSSFFFIRFVFVIFCRNIVSFNYVFLTFLIASKFFSFPIIYFRGCFILYSLTPSFFLNSFSCIRKLFVEYDIVSFTYYFLRRFLYSRKFSFPLFSSSIQSEFFILNVFRKTFFYFYSFSNSNSCISFIPFKRNVFSLSVNCYNIIDSSIIIPFFVLFGISKIKIYNIYNWCYKECSRIHVVCKELKKMGFFVFRGKNWLVVSIYKLRNNLVLFTYSDHRIAMSFSNLFIFSKVYINKPNCVKKTFPNFFI